MLNLLNRKQPPSETDPEQLEIELQDAELRQLEQEYSRLQSNKDGATAKARQKSEWLARVENDGNELLRMTDEAIDEHHKEKRHLLRTAAQAANEFNEFATRYLDLRQ